MFLEMESDAIPILFNKLSTNHSFLHQYIRTSCNRNTNDNSLTSSSLDNMGGNNFLVVSKEVEKDQTNEKKAIVVGPWGGHGGTNWDNGSYNGIREIKLMYARCIDSIQIVYDKNGKPVSSEKHGGTGGNKIAEIKLQFPEEFLTGVSGHYCPVVHGGSPVIRSLTFRSNKRTFGPFGVEEGTPFCFPMEGGQIVGFKGKSGWYLDAIGFYISRIKTARVTQHHMVPHNGTTHQMEPPKGTSYHITPSKGKPHQMEPPKGAQHQMESHGFRRFLQHFGITG